MAEYIPFDPFPGSQNAHFQTILGAAITQISEPPSTQKLIDLPDGDKISLEITTPQNWKPTDETVVLLHGLCGSARSPNIIRTAKRLAKRGIRAVRYNMRGCGSGQGHAKKLYHAGMSGDLIAAVNVLKQQHPDSPVSIAGFSLGAQITLKMAGELGEQGPKLIKQVIAVSPPLDFIEVRRCLCSMDNMFYQVVFLSYLKDHIEYLQNLEGQVHKYDWKINMALSDFDRAIVAPSFGYQSAEDYYEQASALKVMADIRIPCRILFAEDDPLIPHNQLDHLQLPKNILLFKTKHGGHLGFLADPRKGKGLFWMDTQVIEWIFT